LKAVAGGGSSWKRCEKSYKIAALETIMTEGFSRDESIRLAVLGDRAALMNLLQHYGPMVRDRFSFQIPKQWQSVLDLDDLMQETYTDAFLVLQLRIDETGRYLSAGPWMARKERYRHGSWDSTGMVEAVW